MAVAAATEVQLPLSMVALTLVLPGVWARWSNGAIAVVVAAGALAVWPKDADDLVFTAFQLVGLGAIVVPA